MYSSVKLRAKELLLERGNLLRLIFGSFLVFLIFEALYFSYQAVCALFTSRPSGFVLIIGMTVALLVASPFALSLHRMVYRMSKGDETNIGDMFYFCRAKMMRDVFFICAFRLCDFVSKVFLSVALGEMIVGVLSGFRWELMSPASLLLGAVFMIPVSGAFNRASNLPVLYFEVENLADAWSLSKISAKAQPRETVLMNLSFVLPLLISLLTLGIWLIVWVMPLYFLSEVLLSSKFSNDIKQLYFRKSGI